MVHGPISPPVISATGIVTATASLRFFFFSSLSGAVGEAISQYLPIGMPLFTHPVPNALMRIRGHSDTTSHLKFLRFWKIARGRANQLYNGSNTNADILRASRKQPAFGCIPCFWLSECGVAISPIDEFGQTIVFDVASFGKRSVDAHFGPAHTTV